MIGITTQTLADRYLVGRTIARVEVVRMEDPQGRTSTHLAEVVFTDGSSVRLSVAELEYDYAVTATRFKP